MSPVDLHALAKKVGDDWVDGPYYDAAEKDMAPQWTNVIWPMIKGADFTRVVDLAAGHGRNTVRLLEHAQTVVAVDINETNVAFLTERFRGHSKLEIIRNNGSDIRALAGGSITFFYSFDAMVHFDSDVIRAYIKEARRVMKPGALGFCHYSNNDRNPTGSYTEHPGWRNFMNRQLFEHWLSKEGFRIVKSRYLKGVLQVIERHEGECDAMTLFELPADAESQGDFLNLGLGAGQESTEAVRTEIERLNSEVASLTREFAVSKETRDWLIGQNAGLKKHVDDLEKINQELRNGTLIARNP